MKMRWLWGWGGGWRWRRLSCVCCFHIGPCISHPWPPRLPCGNTRQVRKARNRNPPTPPPLGQGCVWLMCHFSSFHEYRAGYFPPVYQLIHTEKQVAFNEIVPFSLLTCTPHWVYASMKNSQKVILHLNFWFSNLVYVKEPFSIYFNDLWKESMRRVLQFAKTHPVFIRF